MTERVSPRSFAAGAALVEAIARPTDDADHPGIDLSDRGGTVRLRTRELDAPSERDRELPRKISAAAREPGIPADPAAVRNVGVTIDALGGPAAMPCWRSLLGDRQEGAADLVDPRRRGPSFWFQQMDAPRPRRNRLHLDVAVPHAAAAIAAAMSLPTASRPPGRCSPMPRATRRALPSGRAVIEPVPPFGRTRRAPGAASRPPAAARHS